MIFRKFKDKFNSLNLTELKECRLKCNARKGINELSMDNRGQGAAEYILLFGGVIVIALAGLLIYRSYFSNTASGLNATEDIDSIRNNMTSLY